MEIIYCEETAKTPQSGYLDSNQGLAAYKAVALPSALHPVNGPLRPLAVIFIVPCAALSDFRVQQPHALPNEPSYIPSACMQKATSRMAPSDGLLQIQGDDIMHCLTTIHFCHYNNNTCKTVGTVKHYFLMPISLSNACLQLSAVCGCPILRAICPQLRESSRHLNLHILLMRLSEMLSMYCSASAISLSIFVI